MPDAFFTHQIYQNGPYPRQKGTLWAIHKVENNFHFFISVPDKEGLNLLRNVSYVSFTR